MNNNYKNIGENQVNNPGTKSSNFIYEWLDAISQPLIVVVVLLTFIFMIVGVDGESMTNTLGDGDKVIITKWNYVPQNGDIVVISRGQHLNIPIIKRVIATQGQTLKIDFETGKVMVNGKVIDEPYIKERMTETGDNEIPEVIPEGYTFVMGDNRNDSSDSRFKNVGLIDNNNIVGKAIFRIYPFDHFGAL